MDYTGRSLANYYPNHTDNSVTPNLPNYLHLVKRTCYTFTRRCFQSFVTAPNTFPAEQIAKKNHPSVEARNIVPVTTCLFKTGFDSTTVSTNSVSIASRNNNVTRTPTTMYVTVNTIWITNFLLYVFANRKGVPALRTPFHTNWIGKRKE